MAAIDPRDSYRQVFHAITDAVFIHDAATGDILDVNDAAIAISGYTRDELLAMDIGALSSGEPPFDSHHASEWMKTAVAQGPQNFEWKALNKNGASVWVEVSLSAAEVANRECVIAVVRDITARKEAEQVHKATERLLEFTQFTVHQVRIAVFWCHSNGRFFYVNDTSCEWLQYSREELMAMHVADINPEFPREAWQAHWQAIKEKGLVQMESVHQRKNGEIYPVEIFSNYVEFEGKEYKMAFVHDISDRRQVESEKAALEDRLRQSQKMEAIGTLAGGVAHDFNNMLSPIIGYAEMLQQTLPDNDPRWAKLNEIFKAGVRARNLTRQLLTFGRKQPLEMKPVNLNDIITGFNPMLRRTIREDVDIEHHLAGSLPAIDGDPGQIEQIILNLAVNAQDAMPDGGTLTIETQAIFVDDALPDDPSRDISGPIVLMAISDTGHGMDANTLERMFEPFFTTKGKSEGTGLGLATSYGIAKQHKGHIWAYSEPKRGTTFKIYFPQSQAVAATDTLPSCPTSPEQGRETVLIVEDQDLVLMLAKDILEMCGYEVMEARNGQSAIDLVQSSNKPIHLLLTDVIMPEMNGKELYECLSALRPSLAVLYMSGYTDNVIVHHGILDKGVNFISKPFGVNDLAARVRQTLNA